MIHKKIQRLFTDLVTHQGIFTMIFSLTGKAIGTVEVAGMCNVQTQGFYHIAGTFFKGAGHVGKSVGAVELSGLTQRFNIRNAMIQFLFIDILAAAVFFHHRGNDLFR